MCGLVGIIAKKAVGFYSKDTDIFKQMLYADAVRGWDATGIFGVTKLGNVDVKKQAAAASHFLNTKQYEEFNKKMISEYQIVIGHNRKATHGEKRHEDAHPFWDAEEKVCLVHNGMISNHKSFCTESTVDSAAIAKALGATEDIASVIGKIEGAFAFIWYNVDEKKLHFIRNTQRPLFLLETDDHYILASEQAMAFWVCNRNGVKVLSMTPTKENVLYTFDMEDRKVHEGETIDPPKKHYPVVTQGYVGNQTTTTGATAGKVNLVEETEGAPDTYYYSDEDFPTVDEVFVLLKRQDFINVEIITYDPPTKGRESYKLECKMINVDKRDIKILMFISKAIFDTLDLTSVIKAQISNIIKSNDQVTIYVHSAVEVVAVQTLNDVMITDEMWFDDRFPMVCDCCNKTLRYRDLANTQVWVQEGTVTTAICPTCSGVQANAA